MKVVHINFLTFLINHFCIIVSLVCEVKTVFNYLFMFNVSL